MRRRVLGAILAIGLVGACSGGPSSSSSAAGSSGATTPISPAASPAASGASASPASASSAASTSTLHWVPALDHPALELATLDVPLDYAQPGGPKVTLMLARYPATDQAHRIGSIVYGAGGPGSSGVMTIRYGAEALFTPAMRARFDIVGFDARGVGASTPAVHCLNGSFSGPATPNDLAAWEAGAKAFVAACEANSGELLPHVGTPDAVQDLERIRAALGEERLTYVGQSYGTVIGAQYADRYPTRVRAMILDAPVDPAIGKTTPDPQGAAEAQRLLDDFLAACAKDPACAFHSGGNARAAFDALMARFEKAPIGGVTAWEARAGTFLLLYSTSRADLAQALAAAAGGDAAQLAAVVSSVEDAAFVAANNAVSCLDTDVPRDPGAVTRVADGLRAASPDFAWFLATAQLCPFWPVPAEPIRGAVHAAGSPPILVIGSTGDPATPYAWSVSLSKELESGALLTRDGLGHTSLGLGDTCIDGAAEAYLVDLRTPAAGLTCR